MAQRFASRRDLARTVTHLQSETCRQGLSSGFRFLPGLVLDLWPAGREDLEHPRGTILTGREADLSIRWHEDTGLGTDLEGLAVDGDRPTTLEHVDEFLGGIAMGRHAGPGVDVQNGHEGMAGSFGLSSQAPHSRLPARRHKGRSVGERHHRRRGGSVGHPGQTTPHQQTEAEDSRQKGETAVHGSSERAHYSRPVSQRIRRTVLHAKRVALLEAAFDALDQGTVPDTHLLQDPLWWVKRYDDPADIEVAAVFASGLAFGRVAAFWPVLAAIFAQADDAGGPAHWVDSFSEADAHALEPLQYRWMRGPDFALLARTLQQARHEGSLGARLIEAHRARHRDLGPALDSLVSVLRDHASVAAGRPYRALPRGFRYFLPRPSDGSACKRWLMMLRWMVRTPGSGPAGVDLGLWPLPPRKLIIPLDTHVLRLSRFIGLTRRTDGSWRTAQEVTRNLARLDPDDPVRFDFALSHLGISGACRQRRVADVCDACELVSVCRVGGPQNRATTG